MLPFDYYWPMRPSTRAHLWSVCFRKVLVSLHFTDNVVDLVSSVAVGLTFKDILTTFRLVCHVLSTNWSCQTKGPKSKTEHLSAWIAYHTSPLECKLTYSWMPITEFFFALLKVSGNRQSLACFTLPSAGLARKVTVSKFNWVFWSCESLLDCL